MEQNTLKRNIWNSAGTAGLALGAVSSAYMFISQIIGTAAISPILMSVLTLALWSIKFGGCIWLMAFFMRKFMTENPAADSTAAFRMGMATALLSAIILAGASFANVSFISADLFNEQYQALLQEIAPKMDSNSLNMVDKVLDNMPYITFFSNLIYCFAYGTALSAILSRNISYKDPFAEIKPDEQ